MLGVEQVTRSKVFEVKCAYRSYFVILANVVKVRQRGNFSSSRVGGSGGSNEVDRTVEGVGDGCLVSVLVVFL